MSVTLPIHAARGALEAALARTKPIVVTAPTGSGKSTCLPSWIAAACGGPVLVVEPRRVACRALAQFLAQTRGEKIGEYFGYRVRFDDRSGPNTQVCFVTPGVALNLLAADEGREGARSGGRHGAKMSDYAGLMLDEFHERSWAIDLLVALARRRAQPRLVVCSATLAARELVRELDAELVESQGRSFPVEIEYLGDDAPTEQGLESRVATVVEAALASGEGEIVVFLPGKGEIERCSIELARRGCAAPVVPVHGGLPPDQLVAAFAPTGRRRVFLATNVAESSLTLPGVRTVIDSGLVRMRVHRGGHSILALAIIARDSMDQRAGRAGRVAPGRCLRLWSSSFTPREVTPPEIERVELDDLVLRAAACGLDGEAFDRAPWLVRPPVFALEKARARLVEIGALGAEGEVLERGRHLARLPVRADRARMLLATLGPLAGTIADLVALLEHGRSLWLPSRHLDPQVEEARAALTGQLRGGQRDEVHAAVLVVRQGDARRHGLHRSGLAEVRRLAESLRKMVGAPTLRAERDRAMPAPGELAGFVLGCVPELAFVRRKRAAERGGSGRAPGRAGDPWGNGEVEISMRDVAIPGLDPEAHDPPAVAGLILEHEWLGVGRSARGRGRMFLPCSLAQLNEMELGELELSGASVELGRGRVRKVVALAERRFAGVCLSKQSQALGGEALRRSLAAMILEGRKLPPLSRGLGNRVRDELHVWDLLEQVVSGPLRGQVVELAKPPQAEAWLEQRLAALGLDTASELELLGDDDLCPRPALLDERAAPIFALGERQWMPDVLAKDFPRVWSDRDAHYGCTVHVERGRVILTPLDATARKRGEPKPDLLPRYRGFSVLFQQASRRVVLRR